MVEAYVTLLILLVSAAIIIPMLHAIPENWREWIWVKLHLDNYEPYDEIDED
jgi:hypothetical protein